MKHIEKDGKIIHYHVTYKNNKHTYYRIKPGFVHITTNKRYEERQIIAFLYARFDRYYALLNHQKRESDDEIMLWGKTYQLVLMHGYFKYYFDDNKLIVYSMNDIDTTKKRIYKDQIRIHINDFIMSIKPNLFQVGIHIVPLKFKYLKSKFGSYHRKHQEITLNTVLAKLDPIFLTYVLYHEYAHTKEFNHSTRFYSLLDHLMPEHRAIQKRLKSVVIM